MPRGVKGSVDYGAMIHKIDEKIERYSAHIASLKNQKSDLEAKQRDAEMQELYCYMKESGMSAREILDHISPAQENAPADGDGQTVCNS